MTDSRDPALGPGAAHPLLRSALDPEDPRYRIVGWGGRRLAAQPQRGDILFRRRGGGSGDLPLGAVADPAVLSLAQLKRAGLASAGALPGRYVRLLGSDGAPAVYRIATPEGFVPEGLSLVRANFEASGEQAPETVWPRATIRRGSSGPAVAEAQGKLNRIDADRRGRRLSGIDACPLAMDGRFGPLTERAVRSFQRIAFPSAPAEWDGVVGPKTWAMLDSHSASPPDLPDGPPVGPIVRVGASVVPVIVLPGVMGTRLELGAGLPRWDPNSALTMLRWLRANAGAKLAGLDFRSPATIIADHSDPSRQRRGWGALVADVYEPLLLGLERGLSGRHPCEDSPGFVPTSHPVWAFGYDWRQSNAVHAARLSAFIDSVLEAEGATSAILVTHSMGGLVARAALPLIRDKVLGIVHTVQPAVGAVAAARRVHTGYHPSIDSQLGELFQELAEAVGVEVPPLPATAGEPIEAGFISNRLFTAIFSDSMLRPNPIYYGQLMGRLPSAVELMPSTPAGAAKPDWMRPRVPAGSIHDHYRTAPPAAGGMILAALPAPDAAEFRTRIDEARAFHAGLGYHPVTGILFGTELKTDNAFDPAARSPEIIERRGDGTVPSFSARCPDIPFAPAFRVGFSRVEHSECFKDAAFLAATVSGVDHIAQRRPPLAEGVRPDRARCPMLTA
jgi:pimeloyl-ACP methyl ester carboxylesterase